LKIAITWDYELFFGEQSGSAEKCMLEPGDRLLEIAQKNGAKFTFFVDAGMLVLGEKEPSFKKELSEIQNQISKWDLKGHETGLHIHPHWEDAIWENGWKFDLKRYKLADFEDTEVEQIFDNYLVSLQQWSKEKIVSYRAGGWCIQPFDKLKSSFLKHQLKIESSIFHEGKNTTLPYNYDFTNAPPKEKWFFENHECEEDESGTFLEIPIASKSYSPLFFWKLFVLGRLFSKRHKSIGNGSPAKGGGSKKDFLTKFNHLCVSADGYFVTEIERAIQEAEKKGWNSIVIIGHPKACTLFSLNYLDKLIAKLSKKHQFVCLKDLAK
jgi:hypothetical protein